MLLSKTVLPNKTWTLRSFPEKQFCATENAELLEEDLDLKNVDDDKIIVEVHAVSIDAFIRTMLDSNANPAHGGVGLNCPIPALGYGKVIRGNDKFKEGAMVTGLMQAAKYSVSGGEGMQKLVSLPRAPSSVFLHQMGISGIAAYIGMFVSPRKYPRKGETVVISAAAGAVGCIAAQMAKLCGARVVGIAGGEKKKEFLLKELKLDGAVDYKSTTKTVAEQLDEQCPDGIDFFFDNVGGSTLDCVLQRINLHARISICGAISQYDSGKINNKQSIVGPAHYIKVAETSSTISGFNMMHYQSHFLKAIGYLSWHYYRGNIVCPEHVEKGINSFAKSLEMLFAGGHCGRLIVDISGDIE
uniref:Enoyl reductase (ER) domain-containing protein n=1 Tax=Chaetoceros debilis TaxID=122233 RepID=A0A7S3PXI6_9STRA